MTKPVARREVSNQETPDFKSFSQQDEEVGVLVVYLILPPQHSYCCTVVLLQGYGSAQSTGDDETPAVKKAFKLRRPPKRVLGKPKIAMNAGAPPAEGSDPHTHSSISRALDEEMGSALQGAAMDSAEEHTMLSSAEAAISRAAATSGLNASPRTMAEEEDEEAAAETGRDGGEGGKEGKSTEKSGVEAGDNGDEDVWGDVEMEEGDEGREGGGATEQGSAEAATAEAEAEDAWGDAEMTSDDIPQTLEAHGAAGDQWGDEEMEEEEEVGKALSRDSEEQRDMGGRLREEDAEMTREDKGEKEEEERQGDDEDQGDVILDAESDEEDGSTAAKPQHTSGFNAEDDSEDEEEGTDTPNINRADDEEGAMQLEIWHEKQQAEMMQLIRERCVVPLFPLLLPHTRSVNYLSLVN